MIVSCLSLSSHNCSKTAIFHGSSDKNNHFLPIIRRMK
nr:MAG TPA: hypothetical protein [Caudoviricetes sp.]